MKQKYIMLYDRVYKGKEWFSSFRSQKFVRSLTEEEAALLDGIEKVTELQPFSQCVVTTNGSLTCSSCKSRTGFRQFKMRKGAQSKWYDIFTCAECGAREKQMLYKSRA